MADALWPELERMAREEITETLAGLPTDLKQRAIALPIVCERVPSAAVLEDGFEPDILGLFVGHDFADEDHAVIPAQILLFLENIWDMVEGDEEEFRFEVGTTLLHELGHYLGLDEDDLDARGLL
jgi:predicted Zn-dependent protease with MMP-like domain